MEIAGVEPTISLIFYQGAFPLSYFPKLKALLAKTNNFILKNVSLIAIIFDEVLWRMSESNRRPPACKAGALAS